MSLIESVRRTIRRYDLLPDGTRVAVAVSGGGDSVGLLSLLLEIARRDPFSVAGLVHVNHQLRGSESERDQAFCEALATRLNVPVHLERVEIRSAAATGGGSPENAARRERYAALERGRQALRADCVAVGHTRDDQAETVLLKLFRGAGPRGIGGVYPRRGSVVRPLIDVGRQQVRAWLADNGITHVEDATNQDLANPRNLVRHRVLPALIEWFGPGLTAVIARASDVARADEEFLAGMALPVFERILREDGERLLIDVHEADSAPLALRRRVLLELSRRAGVREPGFAEVEALRDVLDGEVTSLDLPGRVRVDRIGKDVVLTSRAVQREPVPPFRYVLPVPGRVWVVEAGATVQAWMGSAGGESLRGTAEAPLAALAGAQVTDGLFIRNWRPGDALRPVGLGGRKKVQDIFVDNKVPRSARHRLPLVVDGRDRVVWVPGHALDELYQASTGSDSVVVLKLTRQWGGPE